MKSFNSGKLMSIVKSKMKNVPFTIHHSLFTLYSLFVFLIAFQSINAQNYNRGVGVYPGDPKEDFSPSMKIDNNTYRNLALHRPAYSSSNYDFDLTAQLITDGIKESELPGWIVTSSNKEKIIARNEREWIIDHNTMTRKNLEGQDTWLQIQMAGNYKVPEVDSVSVIGNIFVDSSAAKHWEVILTGSDDGIQWTKLAAINGDNFPGDTLTGWMRSWMPKNTRTFNYSFNLNKTIHYKNYRIELNSPNAKSWDVMEFGLCKNGKRTDVGGPYNFSSSWKSMGSKYEWVYVDLGAGCSFDRIVINWIKKAAAGSIQVSNDSKDWRTISSIPDNSTQVDDIKLNKKETGRYVRVLMTKPLGDDGYILSELEVYGTGGPVPVAHPQAKLKKDGRLDLAGGSWKLQRESFVKNDGEKISKAGFNDNDWMIATVPSTVLMSYLYDGAVPDPNYSDNQMMISDSYFYSDFWYRDEFIAPESYNGKRAFINFDGIDWKAEIYLNGKKLGLIEGAFTRAKYDVTDILLPGVKNILAVRIIKNDAPGFVKEQTKLSHDANGGELGLDNPTFHATVGWDWIPSIRGRDIGIWNDVYLTSTGAVSLEDPFILSDLKLPDTTSADLNVEVTLKNNVQKDIKGKLTGRIGDVKFEQNMSLSPLESKIVKLNPSVIPSLHLQNPKLWWPNGYGKQNLYDVKLSFITDDGKISDSKEFKTGIRKMTYSEDNDILKIYVNGKRFVGKGGNWGFPESNLRYRGREYDIAVRYHKEMNFTMIRNWVGQTGDDEFFEACDKYGIMIWQDFWLANPADGPEPKDPKMFMKNVDDFVRRIRNHPSIGLYCGRNEGNPTAVIEDAIRKLLPKIHPDVHYTPNSASGVVSGGGPYRAMPVKFYFDQRATERLHSELGSPNMVSYESLKSMMPDSVLWPINRMWGIHDFNLESAQYGQSFVNMIKGNFGEVNDLKRWLTLAQWINYQEYRAMFEAQSKNRMGILLWMSHASWPSMVWQTYDYYFEPTAAYFGCKKGCEPLHIQWNALSDSIEVVNYSESNGEDLTENIQILNIDGAVKLEKKFSIDCPIDNIVRCFKLEYPAGLSDVYFVRLKLEKDNKLVSENFYWRSAKNNYETKNNSVTPKTGPRYNFYQDYKEDDLTALNNLGKVKLNAETKIVKNGSKLYLTTTLFNNTKTVAPFVKLKVIREKSKERILPVIFDDNYILLMPGEKKVIKMEFENSDTYGEKPVVALEGINIE
jgi:hypothetical protein